MISYIVSFRESSYPAQPGKTKMIKTYFVEHVSLSTAIPPPAKKLFLGRRRHLLFTDILFSISQAFAATVRVNPFVGRSVSDVFKINNTRP